MSVSVTVWWPTKAFDNLTTVLRCEADLINIPARYTYSIVLSSMHRCPLPNCCFFPWHTNPHLDFAGVTGFLCGRQGGILLTKQWCRGLSSTSPTGPFYSSRRLLMLNLGKKVIAVAQGMAQGRLSTASKAPPPQPPTLFGLPNMRQ